MIFYFLVAINYLKEMSTTFYGLLYIPTYKNLYDIYYNKYFVIERYQFTTNERFIYRILSTNIKYGYQTHSLNNSF